MSVQYIPTVKSPGRQQSSNRRIAQIVRLNSKELYEEQMRVALMARHLEDVERCLMLQRQLREYRKTQSLKLLPPL